VVNLGCCFLLLVRHPPCCSYNTEQFSKSLLSNIGLLVQNDEYNFYALTNRFRKYFAKKKIQLNYEQYTNVSSLFVQIMNLQDTIMILFKRGRKKHLLHFLMIYFYCISFVTTCRPAVLSSIHKNKVQHKIM